MRAKENESEIETRVSSIFMILEGMKTDSAINPNVAKINAEQGIDKRIKELIPLWMKMKKHKPSMELVLETFLNASVDIKEYADQEVDPQLELKIITNKILDIIRNEELKRAMPIYG